MYVQRVKVEQDHTHIHADHSVRLGADGAVVVDMNTAGN